jgi:nitroreductase
MKGSLDVFEAIKERRSIRSFTAEDVSDSDVKRLVDAARYAPSAGNTQPLELVVVRDKKIKQLLTLAALNQMFIQKAPVVFVVCADVTRSRMGYGDRGKKLYSIQDTAAATENILLAAHERGLATCWIGAFREEDVAEAIRAPKNTKPVAIIPVGYPAEKPSAPRRRAADEIVHYETF